MEGWTSILNTALLGTDKQLLQKSNFPTALAVNIDLIEANGTAKEDAFLQLTALVMNYSNCGYEPLCQANITMPIADKETKEYVNALSHRVLIDILESGNISLLNFWLWQCVAKDRIAQPDVIPELLEEATKNNSIKLLVRKACGNRGHWLSQFNNYWRFTEETISEEAWETGTLEQRKDVLSVIHKEQPEKGRLMLQNVWAQENATSKIELLKAFAGHATDDDVPWLESLLAEKSQKVKEATMEILKRLPASSIVQEYWNILTQSIKLSSSKGLFGIGAKTTIEIKLAPVDASLFKTGIQHLSNQTKVTDESFILYQLISAVPPYRWESYFNLDKSKVIDLFLKDNTSKAYISALGSAASRFQDLDWLRVIISVDKSQLYEAALQLLPQREAEKYALQFLTSDGSAAKVLLGIEPFSKEWSVEFTNAVFLFTAKDPYQYNKAFYNKIVHLLPLDMVSRLENFSPKEEYLNSMWKNLSEHIVRLLILKEQTLKAFKD